MLKNFVRQFLLLSEIGVNVVRAFLESKYQHGDFETFLENNKILIFHLKDNYRRGCCTCVNFPHTTVIRKAQFDQLFVTNGQNCPKRAQNCHCQFIANPNIQLVDIDLTLVGILLNNCFTLTPQQKDCAKDIRENRNEISHFAHKKDIDDRTFYAMWGTVTNAAIHLAMCISQDYSNNIRDKIRLLKERTISPVEYTDALLEIYRWKMNHDESTSEILRILQALQLQNVEILDALRYQRSTNNHDNIVPATVARDLQSSESHADICTVIGNHHSHESHYDVVSRNQWSTYDHGKTNRQAVEETECKTVDEHDSVINEDDKKYFKLFGEVNQLRQKGEEDTKCGTLYSILVYIVLHGSATEAEINYEILSNIYNSIYKTAIPSENICIESCLAELVPTYLDQVDEKFTPCNITIVKAVVYFFGNESCECFVRNCSLDIMMDYVVPSCTSIEDFHVVVDIYVLASALVQRIKSKSDARPVGKYVFKAFFDHKNIEISNLFIDTLEQSKEHFTSDHMIHLLDGLTKDGTNFSIFDKLEKLFNVFCRQVDKSGNTILHYLVTRFSESKRFHAYIKFFCESNVVVMQLENDDNHSPIDFAAYQGRYDVIADILSNTESTEEITSRILTMVKEGVDSLQRINLSKSSVDSKLHIATKKSITLGDSKDYENILDIIGRQENACLSGSDVKEEKEEKKPDDEKAKRKTDCSEDISKTVGDGILNMVTEIKKGLNAITKIPILIKTIHQATKIEDED